MQNVMDKLDAVRAEVLMHLNAIKLLFEEQDRRFEVQDNWLDARDRRLDARDRRLDRIEASLASLAATYRRALRVLVVPVALAILTGAGTLLWNALTR